MSAGTCRHGRTESDRRAPRPVPWLASAALLACGALAPAKQPSADALAADASAGMVPACPAAAEGRLTATLRGALQADLDWQGDALACDGMLRPDRQGARLYFAGDLGDGNRLTVVVGVDRLRQGTTGDELELNLTLVVQDRGLFFGSRQQSGCWADVTGNEPLPGNGGGHRVTGEAWCVRALPEIGGDTAVTVTALNFTGVLFDDDDQDD